MSKIKAKLEMLSYKRVKEINAIAPQKLGIKKRQWLNILNGVSKPTADKLPILAELLSCEIADIIPQKQHNTH